MKIIKIKIPATTANFGSGFDVLGAALKLYNEIEVEQISGLAGKRVSIDIDGEGKNQLPKDEKNIVWIAMEKIFNLYKKPLTTYRLRLTNRIPLARGLGSSAAARIGGLVAANKICGDRLSDDEIIRIATELEGHPDNVVPAYYGGLCICNYDGKNVKYTKINMPSDLKAVLCIPDFEVSTAQARKILPKMVPHKDAVFNSSRVALFLSAIVQKRYDLLSAATEDKLHQPYRKKLIPGMTDVFDAALKSGAFCVCISGSGPAILAINNKVKSKKIGESMVNAFKKYNITSKYILCDFNNTGI